MTVLYDTQKYEVVQTSDKTILGEDGQYSRRDGYVVRNKETGVIEHTTIMLPGAIFQCQHFNDTLVSLTTNEADVVELASVSIPEDVVPN